MSAMEQLLGGDVGSLLLGDEGGVAVPVGVEDLELGTWVGRSRRTTSLVPSGQALRSRRSAGSATQAPSPSSPSASTALCHADPGRERIASRTLVSTS